MPLKTWPWDLWRGGVSRGVGVGTLGGPGFSCAVPELPPFLHWLSLRSRACTLCRGACPALTLLVVSIYKASAEVTRMDSSHISPFSEHAR